MTLTGLQTTALGVAGVTSLGIGGMILAAPQVFYASYGIAPGEDASLLSEMRAFGAGLACLGALMLAGLRKSGAVPVSRAAALTVFLAFPIGRLVGVAVDGMPSAPILGALAFELAVAALVVAAFAPRTDRTRPVAARGK